ncbi:MAG: PEP-CTERM system TPR-repeat protein PrsT [Gammaproteobacteria bacterium]|nr:PEP-CTERM system TPR-repeat protein PrsT [Gammaproteobacteria bacterium]
MKSTLLTLLLLMGASGSLATPVDVPGVRLYENALRQFEAGELQQALVTVRDSLQANPGDLAAKVLLGRVRLRLGHAKAAEEALDEALRLGAAGSLVAVPLAQARNQLGHYAQNLATIRAEDLAADDSGDLWVQRGHAALGMGDFVGAAYSFDKATERNPANLSAALGMASVHIEQGDLDQAEALGQRVLAAAPGNADAWFVVGMVLEQRYQLVEAQKHFLKALEIDPNHPKALLARAVITLHRNEPAAAVPMFEAILEKQPWSLEAVYLLSQALTSAGREAAADKALERAAELVSTVTPQDLDSNPRLLLISSLVLYDLGKLQSAAIYIERYLGNRPKDVQARKQAAKIASLIGKHVDAVRELRGLALERPNDVQVQIMLGDVYADMRDFISAEKHYRAAIDMSVPSLRLIGRLGLAQYGQGRTDLAIETMRRLVDLAPGQSAGASIFLGILYLHVGDLEAARVVADDVVARMPDNLLAINLQAVIAVAEKRYDEGRSLFNSVVAREPDYDPARMNLIKLDIVEGRFEAAEQSLNQLLLKDPRNPAVLRTRAEMAIAQNDYPAAILFLEKVLASNPGEVGDALLLSRLQERVGEADAALKQLLELEKRLPEDIAIKLRLAELQIAAGRIDSARTLLVDAAQLAGPHATQRVAVAELQVKAGAYDDALQGTQRVLSEYPDAIAPKLLMARVHVRQQHFNQADDIVSGVLQNHPNDVRALSMMGDVRLARGQRSEALDFYRRAARIEDTPQLALSIYTAQRAGGEDRAALAGLAAWHEAHEPDARVMGVLADHYARIGEVEVAVELYRAVIALDPFNVSAFNNLAVAVMQIDGEEALRAATRAHELAPQNPAVLDTLGWTQVQLGNLETGLARLREALTRNDRVPEIHYHLAVALEEFGNRDAAYRALRRALAGDADFAGRADAERRLRRLEASL